MESRSTFYGRVEFRAGWCMLTKLRKCNNGTRRQKGQGHFCSPCFLCIPLLHLIKSVKFAFLCICLVLLDLPFILWETLCLTKVGDFMAASFSVSFNPKIGRLLCLKRFSRSSTFHVFMYPVCTRSWTNACNSAAFLVEDSRVISRLPRLLQLSVFSLRDLWMDNIADPVNAIQHPLLFFLTIKNYEHPFLRWAVRFWI